MKINEAFEGLLKNKDSVYQSKTGSYGSELSLCESGYFYLKVYDDLGKEIDSSLGGGGFNGNIRAEDEWELVRKEAIYTRYSVNKIIEYDEHAEICLYDKDQNVIAVAKIDIEDIEKIGSYKWSLHNEGYAVYSSIPCLLLHRLITNCPSLMEVDHINHDRLDNRKENLRIVTRTENNMNHGLRNDNKTGCTGVHWCNTAGKWKARIGVGGKEISLGYFVVKQDAINKRKDAEREIFGDYRYVLG